LTASATSLTSPSSRSQSPFSSRREAPPSPTLSKLFSTSSSRSPCAHPSLTPPPRSDALAQAHPKRSLSGVAKLLAAFLCDRSAPVSLARFLGESLRDISLILAKAADSAPLPSLSRTLLERLVLIAPLLSAQSLRADSKLATEAILTLFKVSIFATLRPADADCCTAAEIATRGMHVVAAMIDGRREEDLLLTALTVRVFA
jgi:hypothetical protein